MSGCTFLRRSSLALGAGGLLLVLTFVVYPSTVDDTATRARPEEVAEATDDGKRPHRHVAFVAEQTRSAHASATEPTALRGRNEGMDTGGARACVTGRSPDCCAIAGSVVDASGGPIVGADIRATDERGELLAVAASDGAGGFCLDVESGTTLILARAEGYAPDQRSIAAPLRGVELRLAAASVIVGRVLAEGTLLPVSGVLVTARSASGLPWAESSARSQEDGTFSLSGLRPGRHALSAASDRFRHDESGVALGLAESSPPIELLVHPATRLSGLVQLGDAPCERATVTLGGPMYSAAESTPDGRVVLDGIVPGTYRVSVACAGARKVEALEIANEPVERSWRLERGHAVVGAVLTQRGSAVPGVPVTVTPLGPPEERGDTYCITGQDGAFSCEGLAAGEYEVAVASGASLRSDVDRARVTAGSSHRVVLRTREAGSIRVRLENGASFDAATVSVIARAPNEPALPGRLLGDTIVFESVPLGSYAVFCDSEPAGATEQVTLTRDGEVAELALALPSPHTLHGRVLDEEGQGVPEVWVRAAREPKFDAALPTEPVLTDGEGAFTLAGLVPGHYALDVHAPHATGRLERVASSSDMAVVRVTTTDESLE